MNDIIFRSLFSAGIPASKEPTGLTRLDGKRPDGLTLVPWQGGKPVTWDITVVSTLAQCSVLPPCYLSEGSQVFLSPTGFSFCTNCARNSGAIAPCSLDFLTEVGRRLSAAVQTMLARRHSCFSASLSHFNGSMRYSYTSLLWYPTSSGFCSHCVFSFCF